MPSFKISQLSELTNAVDADFFEIVDDSELTISDKNKRITFENLKLSIFSATRIDSDFPAWNVATTYDSANNPQYVSYNSRLYQFAKSSGTDTGTTPGTDATVWAAVGGVEFFAPPATDAEAAAKTATNRYLTPANLAASGVVDTFYSSDGSLTSNRTVTLGTYTLDINLDSTGTFAIQDGGTDVFTVNASGNVNVQNNELYFGGSKIISIGATSSDPIYMGYSVGNTSKTTGNSYAFGANLLTNEQNGGGTENYAFGGANLDLGSLNGTANTAIGGLILRDLTSGDNNIGIGKTLGGSQTTANRAIYIGDNISNASNYSNILCIGTQAAPEESNSIKIGGGINRYNKLYLNNHNNSNTNYEIIHYGESDSTDGSPSDVIRKLPVSTGTGEGGFYQIQCTPAGASGTTQNAYSTVFEVGGNDKIGMYGVTPTTRATTGIGAATFTANTSGISDDTATWGGYTIGQVVQALQTIGILT